MKTVFNLEALVSVEIKDKKECRYLVYEPFKKSFWGNTKEGFYFYGEACYTKEEIEKGKFCDTKLQVEDKKVFYKPYVRLTFAGGKISITEFPKYEAAVTWGTEMANKGINIKLEINK